MVKYACRKFTHFQAARASSSSRRAGKQLLIRSSGVGKPQLGKAEGSKKTQNPTDHPYYQTKTDASPAVAKYPCRAEKDPRSNHAACGT